MRLELNHLLYAHHVISAAAVLPELVDHLLVHTIDLAKLVIIQGDAHEFVRGDKLQLATEVGNTCWVQLHNDLKEGRAVTPTLIECLLAHSNSSDVDIRRLD